jgi:8-oxo-dGTP diphosphatase
MSEVKRPKVGTSIWVRKGNTVLLGKRRNSLGEGTWASPGGHLEMFEEFEDHVRREIKEETGLEIANVRLVTAINSLSEGRGEHYVVLEFVADWAAGEPGILEPEKCEAWDWFEWDKLPEPLFSPTRIFVENGYNPFTI